MKKRKLHTGITALAASMCAVLAACGGGGSSGNNSGSASASASTTGGVAAIGVPIVGGTIALTCASGATASATTGPDGTWSASLKSTDYPCVATVSGGQANGSALASALHSVAPAPGTSNITPLTDLIVGVLGGGNAAALDSVKPRALGMAITADALASAKGKLIAALATLPGKPALPNGFDPLTSQFSAVKGDAGDDLLESYGAALTAAGLSQSDAAVKTANGTALTQAAYSATAFTTPYVSPFTAGWSKNLDGKTVLSIPDPLRSALVAEVNADATTGNFALAGSAPFTDLVSLLGNRVGTLCVPGKGQASDTQHSLYIYVSPDFTPVNDLAEIKSALANSTWDTYEDCTKSSITYTTTATGLTATYSDGSSDAITDVSFSDAGNTEKRDAGTGVHRMKLYKYTDTASGKTTYAIVEIDSDQDSTDLVYDLGRDLNNIILSVSQ